MLKAWHDAPMAPRSQPPTLPPGHYGSSPARISVAGGGLGTVAVEFAG
jgi:hypothetical protein